jgi:hypothetical protein
MLSLVTPDQIVNFHGEKRSNETHASTTQPADQETPA